MYVFKHIRTIASLNGHGDNFRIKLSRSGKFRIPDVYNVSEGPQRHFTPYLHFSGATNTVQYFINPQQCSLTCLDLWFLIHVDFSLSGQDLCNKRGPEEQTLLLFPRKKAPFRVDRHYIFSNHFNNKQVQEICSKCSQNVGTLLHSRYVC